MSYSLRPYEHQRASFHYPSLSPRICSNSCPPSQWCHSTISSPVSPFSSCPQFFPASGSFPMSWLFTSGSQSIGASASVLPMNIQGWYPLGLIGLISMQSKGLSSLLQYHSSKAPIMILLQFGSVTQLCPTLCDPMNRSMPGLPVHHQLPEFTQTHVHRVGDAIQPSHPLSSPSPPAPNPSQHQSLFQWVNSSH